MTTSIDPRLEQPFQESFQYGQHQVTLETGQFARQADGAVMVRMGDTHVLVTAVGRREADPNKDFFPLMVLYQEKTYAAGKIPGGFFRREGRPSGPEVLTSRLIDRPLRPLFPKEFKNEVQVVATVMSVDPQILPDIPAMIGASAALAISGMPFAGPIAGARVGYQDGNFILNPEFDQLATSELDLIVAGTQNAVLMVESGAAQLSEEVMLNAVMFGHEQMQVAVNAINALAAKAGKEKWQWQEPEHDTTLITNIETDVKAGLVEAYQVADKMARQEKISALRDDVYAKHIPEDADTAHAGQVKSIFEQIEKYVVRDRILSGEPRIDGRDTKTVRPIHIQTGILPRVHGSAVFTRGETQAIVASTLGTERDAQILDSLQGDSKDNFMLHYNFPPYSVGETGMMGSPKRREIGHGNLAKRSLLAVMPSQEEFPYALRIVSEITESNGSSSMATVCGSSLALMDGGIPIKAHVAGIAMGLVKEQDKYVVLTDILGDEDHLGDMDFKVAGTRDGVTALQMDIKTEGITAEIMEAALAQARDARLHILEKMEEQISEPRSELSTFAPRIFTIQIHPDKIREVIGKGGETIRSITDETGVTIDINDDGLVKVYATDGEGADAAIKRINDIVVDVEVDKIYEGTVTGIKEFGAFVTILPGRSGLLHISQISEERVNDVNDYLKEGQVIRVRVLGVDDRGRIKLSMKSSVLEG